MPDPIQVDQSFRELMGHFDSTLSIRHRYRLFTNFVENLEGSFKKYESYILQIVDELPEYSEPLTWSGIDPEQVELDLALLNTLNSFLHLSEKSKNFERVKNRLTEVCLLLYGCLSDVRGVNHHLKISFGLSGLSETVSSTDSRILDVLASRLSKELQPPTVLSSDKQDQLNRIIQEIKEIQSEEKWKVLIPVAERYQKNSLEIEEYGRLRKVSVNRYSKAMDEDELILNTNIYGASNPSSKEIKNLLFAARSLFESTSNNWKKSYYRGGVSFQFPNAFHDGNSANLAIAALWYTRLLEVSEDREKLQLRSHSVITGDIDREGVVLPVDDKIVALKLQAAFFSWARVLAVPAGQEGLFESELERLRERYPCRDLELIGVHHLREIFFDRRLASQEVEGHISYYYKKVKNQKYRAVTAPLIIALLGVIGWLMVGPVNQNPVSADFEGKYMILKNQFGQEIRSLEVGAMVIHDLQVRRERLRNNKVDFLDLNKDGINEVFYAKNLNTQNESREEVLVAYSVSGDSLIWEKPLRFDLEFPNKPSIGEDGYRIFNINFLNDASKDQSFIVVNVAHNQFFPGLILKINPETGEESARYIHTGVIYQIITHDVNGDETDEIIGLAVNNAFDEETVAFLLNANEMDGHSPLNEEYELNGYQKAKEVQYVRFPRSIVGDAFRKRFLNNRPYYLQIDEDEESILVRVYEFIISEPTPFEKDSASLLFYFNYDFELQSLGTDSSYDLWAKNLYEDGRIPFEPDHEYFEAFKDSLLYWNQGKFSNK